MENMAKQLTVQETIEQIHHEFNIEGELLLGEAKKILSTENLDTSKAERLSKMGFKATKEVKQAAETIERKAMSEKMAKTIEHYQFHYPQNRFINEDGVKRICEKYGLVCAPVGRYIGGVPLKNLKEIENFKLKTADIFYSKIDWSNGSTEITKEEYHNFFQNVDQRQSSVANNILALMICAPVKDIQLSSREKVEGHKIVQIPDPVVLKPVREGYLIVTAWGIEAEDEEVKNANHN